jgi:hypothetical protein
MAVASRYCPAASLNHWNLEPDPKVFPRPEALLLKQALSTVRHASSGPGLSGVGYGETKIIGWFDFVSAIFKDEQPSPNSAMDIASRKLPTRSRALGEKQAWKEVG